MSLPSKGTACPPLCNSRVRNSRMSRKKGSKHTLLVDRHGVPMAIRTAGANASDHTQIIPIVLAFPKVGGKPGRPKEMPDDLYADRGYDSDDTRLLLSWLGIEPHIARRRT